MPRDQLAGGEEANAQHQNGGRAGQHGRVGVVAREVLPHRELEARQRAERDAGGDHDHAAVALDEEAQYQAARARAARPAPPAETGPTAPAAGPACSARASAAARHVRDLGPLHPRAPALRADSRAGAS